MMSTVLLSRTVESGGWCHSPCEASTEGPWTFTVVATDAAGNQTTRTRDVVVDLSAPAVAIVSPTGEAPTKESSVAVTGTVVEEPDCSLS
jgi:hypothetical protein